MGIRAWRAMGTCSEIRSGRRRPPSGFRARLTKVAVTPIEASPAAAARLPRRPPSAARIAADAIESRE